MTARVSFVMGENWYLEFLLELSGGHGGAGELGQLGQFDFALILVKY